MVRFTKVKEAHETTMAEDDIESIIDELRSVLKSAADSDEADRKVILDLTKTIEDLTERKVDKMRDWDPAYGQASANSLTDKRQALLKHLQEVEEKLPKAPAAKKRRRRRQRERGGTSLRGIIRSLIERLSG
ncbi:MAG: hypothetical protein WED04_10035 [Promethearchaeati archaeon SRVP18_Atabeyarchaeia-1]